MSALRYFALQDIFESHPDFAVRIKPYTRYEVCRGDAYVSHPILGKGHRPPRSAGSYDENGFRTGSFVGDVDVAMFGDSFMEAGLNDSDTFSEHFSKISGLSSANFGTSYWGPIQSVIALKKYGLQRHPKLALLSFFEGNDLWDIVAYSNWEQGRPYHDFPDSSASFMQRFQVFLLELRSFFDRLFLEKVRLPIARFRGRAIDALMRGAAHFQLGTRGYWDVLGFYPDERTTSEIQASGEYQKLRQVLAEFKQIGLEAGFPVLIMYIPMKGNVYAEYFSDNTGQGFRSIAEKYKKYRGNIERAVRSAAEELDIPFVSLVPLFREYASKDEFLYYQFDGHWNSRGRSLAAHFLSEQITKLFPEIVSNSGSVSQLE